MLEVKQRIIEFINRRQVFDSVPAELVKPDGNMTTCSNCGKKVTSTTASGQCEDCVEIVK